jgi:phage N-6-adenine-methyltransferase
MPEQKPGRSRQDYCTPKEFIAAVENRFGQLTIDLAATARNTRVPNNYFSPKDDSLVQNWRNVRRVGVRPFLNPPFGNIAPWAAKCLETAPEPSHTFSLYFLVPASVGSNWWFDYVHDKAHVYFLSPRLSFDGKNSFPKDCALIAYGDEPGYECWRWKK